MDIFPHPYINTTAAAQILASFPSLRHVSSSFAENGGNKKNIFLSSVSPKCTNNIIISVLRDSALQQNENYGATQKLDLYIPQCVHKSGNDGNINRNLPGALQLPYIAPNRAPIVSSTCRKQQKTADHPAASAAKHNLTIQVRDYKPLELPEPKSVCPVCGKKGSS